MSQTFKNQTLFEYQTSPVFRFPLITLSFAKKKVRGMNENVDDAYFREFAKKMEVGNVALYLRQRMMSNNRMLFSTTIIRYGGGDLKAMLFKHS